MRTLNANLKYNLVTECIEISILEDVYHIKRPIYAGKVIQTIKFNQKPIVISLKSNSFAIEDLPQPAIPPIVTIVFQSTPPIQNLFNLFILLNPKNGGHDQIRTDVHGFAGRCVTTPPRGLVYRICIVII